METPLLEWGIFIRSLVVKERGVLNPFLAILFSAASPPHQFQMCMCESEHAFGSVLHGKEVWGGNGIAQETCHSLVVLGVGQS